MATVSPLTTEHWEGLLMQTTKSAIARIQLHPLMGYCPNKNRILCIPFKFTMLLSLTAVLIPDLLLNSTVTLSTVQTLMHAPSMSKISASPTCTHFLLCRFCLR